MLFRSDALIKSIQNKQAENVALADTASDIATETATSNYDKASDNAAGLAEMAATAVAYNKAKTDASTDALIKSIQNKQAENVALADTSAEIATETATSNYDKASDNTAGLAEMAATAATYNKAKTDASNDALIKSIQNKQAEGAAISETIVEVADANASAAYDKDSDNAAGLAEMAATAAAYNKAKTNASTDALIKSIQNK